MNICTAPGLLARRIDVNVSIRRTHDAHHLTFALHCAAAHAGSLRNMLRHAWPSEILSVIDRIFAARLVLFLGDDHAAFLVKD